jgi:hypothetical protein
MWLLASVPRVFGFLCSTGPGDRPILQGAVIPFSLRPARTCLAGARSLVAGGGIFEKASGFMSLERRDC